ncbi:nitrilase-related carbon-nitrogen hydrolase [Dactylosporangium sp. NPDC050688]|uniref:nitrilase-related carbon-nitrogen hydrolase n=1 Tax=Dactylosporangium sp. NPDC050688 TaxID=3157217 RepID=UPI0033E39770
MAIAPYGVACIQSPIRQITDANDRDEVIQTNINRILSLIDYSTGRFGRAKLALLPEFSLQGYDHFETVEEMTAVCVTIPGPEIDRLSAVAVEKGIYIAGNAFEVDPDWPGRWFNTAFLIDDRGEVILKYRKIHCGSVTGRATNTSPGDVLSEYLDRYGLEGLFPVADTPLGRIGMMVCYDVTFPEVARSLMIRGAELILHPTGEPYGAHRPAWRRAKATRAYENKVYLASANHAAYYAKTDEGIWTDAPDLAFAQRQSTLIPPSMRSHGHSEVIDFNGTTIAEIGGPGEATVIGTIDIERLRFERNSMGLNFAAQLMPEMFAHVYQSARHRPVDMWKDSPIQHWQEGRELLRKSIDGLRERGSIMPSIYSA